MKISIALTLVILALGLPFGWRYRQQLASAREFHAQLAAQAAKSGLIYDPTRRPTKERGTRREREDKQEIVKKLATDIIDACGKNNISPELLAGVASLDAASLKILFTEILASPLLIDPARRKLLFKLAEVASDQPQAALAMLTESVDLTKESDLAKDLISASLAKWAKGDPAAMLGWIRSHEGLFAKFVDGNNKLRIVSSAAVQHPALALRLVDQIGLNPGEKATAFREIPQQGETAEDRTNMHQAITTYLASLPAGEGKDRTSELLFHYVIYDAARDGCEAATQWFDQVGLVPTQVDGLRESDVFLATPQPGKWIEWLGKMESSGEVKSRMADLMGRWTYVDRKAVGEWLTSTAEGPTKKLATMAFVKTVAEFDPQMAEKWAMTLPTGEDRKSSLTKIYANWPKNDEAAKQAFRERYGIAE